MLSNQQTEELKKIYLEEFGISLTTSETLERAVLLIEKPEEVMDRSLIKEKIEKLLFSEKTETAFVDNLALYFVSLARNISQSKK